MRFRKTALTACIAVLTSLSFNVDIKAVTWQVGPTRTYTMPSQVAGLVNPGDVVEIDAGTYESDVAGWYTNNITLRGVGGMAHLKANGNAYGQKAIWVIAGNNYLIEHVEFSLCTVPDMNGAGIRLEGQNLILRHCFFHHNENGILTSASSTQNLTVEFCEFGHNGYGDGYTHNLYINHIDTLLFRYNYSHHAKVGHEIKSRAHVNYILYNRITNEETGNASRCIDLPNGGTAFIIGNVIHQGTHATNNNALGYGLEGLTNPAPHHLYVINNTFYNQRSICNFLNVEPGTSLFKAYNNLFAGNGNFLLGTPPPNTDTASNIHLTDVMLFAFQDAANYDFRLTALSLPAIDHGTAPGNAGTLALAPQFIYVHPCSMLTRCLNGTLDIGAYEYCGNTGVAERPEHTGRGLFTISPNPASQKLFIERGSPSETGGQIRMYNVTGHQLLSVLHSPADHWPLELDISALAPGLYLLKISDGMALEHGWVVIY